MSNRRKTRDLRKGWSTPCVQCGATTYTLSATERRVGAVCDVCEPQTYIVVPLLPPAQQEVYRLAGGAR